jgi:uncharacterized membrane protein
MLTQQFSNPGNKQLDRASVNSSSRTYLLILAGAIVWCVAIVIPPLFLSAGGVWEVVGLGIYQFFHPICHQLDNRSFHILGEPFAVCIRCFAIYAGFLVGALFYPLGFRMASFVYTRRGILLWSVFPMVIDVLLDESGIHSSSTVTRLVTGLLFGVIIPLYIIPSAQEAVQEIISGSRFFSPSAIKKGSLHA